MNNILEKFKSSNFLMSITMLASGSIIAQIIAILISPVSTRLFTPEQFGAFTLMFTAVSLFGPIICLKYDMAIVTSKSEEETYSLIKLCFLISIILSVFFSIIYGMLFIGKNISGMSLSASIIVIAFLLFNYAINNILLAHNNRNGLYKLISSVTVVKSLFNNGLLILTGLFGMGTLGLIISQVTSSIVGVGRQSKDLRNNFSKFKNIDKLKMKNVFSKNKNQALYNAPSAMITTSIYSSINLFIQGIYSVEQLGLYSLSYRVLGIPFSVISANIARVFFDNAAKEKNKVGNFRSTYKKTFIILLCTIIPIILILAFISPWIFSRIFGQEWASAGLFVQLLAPMFAVRLIAESLTTSFIVSEKQYMELFFQLSLFFGEIIIYIITYLFSLRIEMFLALISFVYIVVYTIMLIYMNKLSKENRYLEKY